MASTLCVEARRDIRVTPGIVDLSSGTHEAEQSLQIAQLVRLMRATCLDVAESPTKSDVQLANSTICIARAVKLSGTQKDEEAKQIDVEGLPAELEHMTWGKVVRYKDDPFNGFIRHWSPACSLVSQLVLRLEAYLT